MYLEQNDRDRDAHLDHRPFRRRSIVRAGLRSRLLPNHRCIRRPSRHSANGYNNII